MSVHQDGDDGFGAFLFDVSDFDAVADVILPRKRRKLTPEQREAAQLRLRDYQFVRTSERNIEAATS